MSPKCVTFTPNLLDDCMKVTGDVRVDSSNQVFYVQTPGGGGNASH